MQRGQLTFYELFKLSKGQPPSFPPERTRWLADISTYCHNFVPLNVLLSLSSMGTDLWHCTSNGDLDDICWYKLYIDTIVMSLWNCNVAMCKLRLFMLMNVREMGWAQTCVCVCVCLILLCKLWSLWKFNTPPWKFSWIKESCKEVRRFWKCLSWYSKWSKQTTNLRLIKIWVAECHVWMFAPYMVIQQFSCKQELPTSVLTTIEKQT